MCWRSRWTSRRKGGGGTGRFECVGGRGGGGTGRFECVGGRGGVQGGVGGGGGYLGCV